MGAGERPAKPFSVSIQKAPVWFQCRMRQRFQQEAKGDDLPSQDTDIEGSRATELLIGGDYVHPVSFAFKLDTQQAVCSRLSSPS